MIVVYVNRNTNVRILLTTEVTCQWQLRGQTSIHFLALVPTWISTSPSRGPSCYLRSPNVPSAEVGALKIAMRAQTPATVPAISLFLGAQLFHSVVRSRPRVLSIMFNTPPLFRESSDTPRSLASL
jgi:hypothetical protein